MLLYKNSRVVHLFIPPPGFQCFSLLVFYFITNFHTCKWMTITFYYKI